MTKECVICKKMFYGRSNNAKCCSKECSKKQKTYNDGKHDRREYFKEYSKSFNGKLASRKYNLSNKGKLTHVNSQKKWLKSEKGKIYQNNYFKSDLFKKIQKKYQETDKAQRLIKIWRQTPRAKSIHLKATMKRRAMKNNIIEIFTFKEFEEKIKEYHNLCPMCHNEFNNNDYRCRITLDHIFPISKANEEFKQTGIKRVYTIDDIQPLCHKCNSSKRDKILLAPAGARQEIEIPLLNNNMINIQNQKVYKPQNNEICMVENKTDNSQIIINELKGGNNKKITWNII